MGGNEGEGVDGKGKDKVVRGRVRGAMGCGIGILGSYYGDW